MDDCGIHKQKSKLSFSIDAIIASQFEQCKLPSNEKSLKEVKKSDYLIDVKELTRWQQW